MRQVLQRLVVLLAFAGAFIVPSVARAALLPDCDAREQLTRMPAEWLERAPGSTQPQAPTFACNLGEAHHAALADDADEVKVAGMCDDRGASVVAPPRVHPLGNARIEASRSCGSDGPAAAGAIAHRSHEVPGAGGAPVLAEHAVLDAACLVPCASSELGPAFLPVAGGPRLGAPRNVDRPPR